MSDWHIARTVSCRENMREKTDLVGTVAQSAAHCIVVVITVKMIGLGKTY